MGSGLRRLISRSSPQALLVWGFAGLIIVGALLLLLPISHAPGRVGPLTALFTSTSAVCVTGLVVVDTSKDFTVFGQVVILVLIQLGGLGVMTFAALIFRLLGRRMSLSSRAALQDSFSQRDMASEFRSLFGAIVRMVATIEFLGALVLFLALLGTHGPGRALYSAVFHSISAFCNAGFSIYTDNLMGLRDSPVIVATVMFLIVLGGLGHMVLTEVWHQGRNLLLRLNPPGPHPLSTHSRVVLKTTLALIILGWLGLLLLGLTPGETTLGAKLAGALFQSVTARTAGFNTVDISLLPLSSLLLLTLLMFIGGSPGSCAGGVKTTCLVISLAEFRAKLQGADQVVIMERRVPKPILDRTLVLIRLSILWNLLGVLLLLYTETGRPGVGFHDVLFEQISAFGTVGLSTGLTGKLSVAGRLWLIATMFVGRLGPLTIALGLLPTVHPHVRYPEDRIMIG